MRFLASIRNDMDRFAARKGEAFESARRLVSKLAKEARADARAALRGPRTGRAYGGGTDRTAWRVTKKGKARSVRKLSLRFRAYTASAAGEAPATRTGQLLRSVRVARVRGKAGLDAGFRFFVFADRRTAFYQRFLEFGVKRRGLAKRPLFAPLEERYQRRLAAELPAALQAGLDKVAGR
jgi:hypothetical protein